MGAVQGQMNSLGNTSLGNSQILQNIKAIAAPKFNWEEGLRQSDKYVQNIQKGKIHLDGFKGTYDMLTKKAKDLANEQARVARAFSQQTGPGQMQMYVPAAGAVKNFASEVELSSRKLAIQSEMLSSIGTNVQNWGKNMQWAGRQLMVGFTIPFAAGAAAAGVAAYQIDKELTRIQKVYDGTTKNLRQMGLETAKEAAKGMGAAPKETLDIMAQLAATGKTGNDLKKSTLEVQRLATLGEMDYQEAIKSTIALQSTFKMSSEELASSINYMNSVENATSLSMADFAETIPRAAAPVAQLGGSIQDLGTIMVAMKERGVDAAEGANAIKSTMNRLLNPGKQTQELFQSLTGKDLPEFINTTQGQLMPTMAGLADIVMNGNLTLVQQQRLIGQLAGSYQLTRMTSILDGLASKSGQVKAAMDVAAQSESQWAAVASKELEAQTMSISGKFKIALNSFKIELQEFGEVALKAATFIITNVTKIFDFINSLPDWVKGGLLGTGAILAIAGPITMIVGIFANFVGTMVKAGASAMRLGTSYKSMTLDQKAAQLTAEALSGKVLSQASAVQVLVYQLDKLRGAYLGVNSAAVAGTTSQSSAKTSNSALAAIAATKIEREQAEKMARLEQQRIALMNNPRMFTSTGLAVSKDASDQLKKLQGEINHEGTVLNQAIGNRRVAVKTALAEEKAMYLQALKENAAAQKAVLAAQTGNLTGVPTTVSTPNGSLKQDAKGRWLRLDETTGKTTGLASKQEIAAVESGFNSIATSAGNIATQTQKASIASKTFKQETMFGVSAVAGLGSMVAETGSGLQTWLSTITIFTGLLSVVLPMLQGIGPAMTGWIASSGGKMKGLFGDIATWIGKVGSKIGSALFNPWTIGIAAVGLAAFGVYRLITAASREQLDHMDKLANSTDGWMKTLGKAKISWGEIRDEAGNVKETMDSLANKFRTDNPDLTKEFSSISGDRLLEQARYETYKLQGQGLNKEDILKGLEIALTAAGKKKEEIEKVLSQIKIGFDFTAGEKDLNSFVSDVKTRLKDAAQKGNAFQGDAGYGDSAYGVTGRGKAGIEETKAIILGRLASMNPVERAVFAQRLSKDFNDSIEASFKDLKGKYGDKLKGSFSESVSDMLLFDKNAGGYAPKLKDGTQSASKEQTDLAFAANSYYQLVQSLGAGLGIAEDTRKEFKALSDLMPYMSGKTLSAKDVQDAYNGAIKQAESGGRKLTAAEKAKMAAVYESATGFSAAKLQVNGYSDANAKSADTARKNAAGIKSLAAALDDASSSGENFWQSTALSESGFDILGGDATAQAGRLTDSVKGIYSGAMSTIYDTFGAEAERQFQAQIDGITAYFQRQKDALDAEGKTLDKTWDARMRQFSDDWDARMESTKQSYKDREKAVEDEADAQIKAIEDQEKAAKELDDERERIFQAEKRRIERLTELANRNIDYNRALATGNLDEAARIQNNTQRITVGWGADDANEEDKRKSDLRSKGSDEQKKLIDDVRKHKLDSLKEEEDAVERSLEKQKEMQQRALEDQKDIEKERLQDRMDSLSRDQQETEANARRKQEIEKRALEIELATLKAFIPMNEAQLNAHIARVQGAYSEHGVQLTFKGTEWGQIVGNALQSNVDRARMQMSNDSAWAQFGSSVANAITQGAFGMDLGTFFNMLVTGQPPEGWQPPGASQGFSNVGKPTHGAFHVGGMVGSDQGGRLGRTGGLYPDEQMKILQRGEYVVNRDAVSKLGSGYLEAINSGRVPDGFGVGGADVGMAGIFGSMAGMLVASLVKSTFLGAKGAQNTGFNGNISQDPGVYGGVRLGEEQLTMANIIASVGQDMGASPRDIMISLMTAMQESGLRNLHYGDRDSQGLFQQRPSQGWGSVEQVTDPYYASRKFFSVLFNVADRDSMPPTLAAQAVQRSAFPYAYAAWQDMAEDLMGAGVGSGASGIKGFGMFSRMANRLGGNAGNGAYIKPTSGPITSEYGWRTDPFTGATSLHDGIDIGAGSGTPIHATAAGRVIQAGWNNGGFGNWTLIDHNGVISGYAHQSNIAVGPGQTVGKGQVIGYVGSTGRSTGSHLHFQLGPGPGRFQNPRNWIPSMAVGGEVKYDNTIANLHKKETVLTAPLSEKLKTGIDRLSSGGDTYIDVTVNGTNLDEKGLKNAIRDGIMEERKLDLKKRGMIK